MSSGINKNGDYYVTVNTVKFTHLTSCTLNTEKGTIDVTSFDSSGWRDFLEDDKGWSIDIEAFFAQDAAEGGVQAIVDLIATSTVALLLTTGDSGDVTYAGNAIPTSVNVTSSKGAAATVSASYQGTSTLTPGTVA